MTNEHAPSTPQDEPAGVDLRPPRVELRPGGPVTVCTSCGSNLQFNEDLRWLRDEFAMAALTGLIIDPKVAGTHYSADMLARIVAVAAYRYADAMLAERAKGNG